ncbi:hypothetical protein BJY00DRAFT_318462 [Aspergillus carlsbadensis]|nr:hypothetical protein BJY00DRAFT_318462 [Aspergillus carlsbadensis]
MHLKAIALLAFGLAPSVAVGQSSNYECTTPNLAPSFCCVQVVRSFGGGLDISNGCIAQSDPRYFSYNANSLARYSFLEVCFLTPFRIPLSDPPSPPFCPLTLPFSFINNEDLSMPSADMT